MHFGTFPMLITLSMTSLPTRFNKWSRYMLSKWQSSGLFPKIGEYLNLLLEENRNISRNEYMHQYMSRSTNNGYPQIYNVCDYPDYKYLNQGQSIIRQHTHTPSVGQGYTEHSFQGRGGVPIPNNNIGAATDSYIQMSCERCVSNDGTHTAKNCHSRSYCDKCGNWSHLRSECRGVYSCK